MKKNTLNKLNNATITKKIPSSTIKRLSIYHRFLQLLATQGTHTISSQNLANLLNLNPALVRKDLSYFGSFGKQGIGYNVYQLAEEISHILGISKEKRVIIIGAGNLGTALAAYKGFSLFGFNICAIFDVDTHKVGKKIRGVPCYHIDQFETVVKKEKIEMAVITVPAESAQDAALLIVKSGIKAMLNFAPVRLNVPEGIKASNVDLALELKSLSFFSKSI